MNIMEVTASENSKHVDIAELALPMNEESELDYERIEELLRAAIARAESGTITECGSNAGESEWREHAKVVREQLHKRKLKFSEQEDEERIFFCGLIRIDSDPVDVLQFSISVDRFCVQSTFYLPIRAKREQFGAVAEFCALVNYSMRFGKFLVDFVDGEMSFRLSFSPAAVIGSPKETVRDLINLPKDIINTYVSGIVAVLRGEDPCRAYKFCDPDFCCDDGYCCESSCLNG